MKQTINRNAFVQAFNIAGRENQFSVAGREALFDYITQLEDDTGVDIDAKCLGLSAWVDGDSTSKLNTNRGLHIQIRHNRDKETFEAASQLANILTVAPQMLKVLIEAERHLGGRDDLCHRIQDLIKKAKGES